jgi:hypothetical protein
MSSNAVRILRQRRALSSERTSMNRLDDAAWALMLIVLAGALVTFAILAIVRT